LQDNADSQSIYSILEGEIAPLYYNKNVKGFSTEWIKKMKNSIKSVGGVYNTNRMLCDYLDRLYVPQLEWITGKYASNENVEEFFNWKNNMQRDWNAISVAAPSINDEVSMKAGDKLNLTCHVTLGNIPPASVTVEVFYGKFVNGEKIINSIYKEMQLAQNLENGVYEYKTEIAIDNGGNYGYTFRVLPKHDMLINKQDMSLVKWIEY